MKKFIPIILAILLCCAFVLTGCSKQIPNYMDESADALNGNYAPSANDGVFNKGEAGQEAPRDNNTPSETSALLENRKIIKNANLHLETLEYDKFITNLTNEINKAGGYIQNQNERTKYKDLRSAEITLRIPADQLDAFLNTLDGLGNITSKNIDVSDITDTYVDIEAHLTSLRTEYNTLLNLLEQADNLDDVVMLQDRLTSVRYQIESYEARKRTYDSQIAYSTVSLVITEVERQTVVEKESFGAEVSRRFKESLKDVGEGFRTFGAWFLGEFPSILVFVLFAIALPVLIIVAIIKGIKKKKAKKAARKAQAAPKAETETSN